MRLLRLTALAPAEECSEALRYGSPSQQSDANFALDSIQRRGSRACTKRRGLKTTY